MDFVASLTATELIPTILALVLKIGCAPDVIIEIEIVSLGFHNVDFSLIT